MEVNKINIIETWSKAKILGEETWDITLFKHTEKGRNDLIDPHKHDFYLIFFVEEGYGIHEIDFKQYEVQPLQVHFLRPQQVHYWKLSSNTIGYQLMFSNSTINLLSGLSIFPFFQLDVPPVLKLNQKEYQSLKIELDSLHELLLQHENIDQEISILQFFLLLKKIQKYYTALYSTLVQKTTDPKIQEFKHFLEKHFTENNQVTFYADKLNITANYLNIRCKKKLGVTASEIIQQRVILEAERLLITTNMSVKEITFALGFSDTGYFNHYFKKKRNKTPGQFRSSYNIYNKE